MAAPITMQPITAPATDAAKQWQGWGTALKPALEPITVARKPLGEKTVAANVLEHGTGALNIDGCRVGEELIHSNGEGAGGLQKGAKAHGARPYIAGLAHKPTPSQHVGRWPANLILTCPEDEFILMDGVTPDQLHTLANWLNENSKH